MLKDIAGKMVARGVRRQDVAYLRDHHEMERALGVQGLGLDRSVVRYRSCRGGDAGLRHGLLILPLSGGALGIGGCTCWWCARAWS